MTRTGLDARLAQLAEQGVKMLEEMDKPEWWIGYPPRVDRPTKEERNRQLARLFERHKDPHECLRAVQEYVDRLLVPPKRGRHANALKAYQDAVKEFCTWRDVEDLCAKEKISRATAFGRLAEPINASRAANAKDATKGLKIRYARFRSRYLT